MPEGQVFSSMQAMEAFVIVLPAFPLQGRVHTAAAVVYARGCDLFDARKQC